MKISESSKKTLIIVCSALTVVVIGLSLYATFFMDTSEPRQNSDQVEQSASDTAKKLQNCGSTETSGSITVFFTSETTPERIDQIIAENGLSVTAEYATLNGFALAVEAGKEQETLVKLTAYPEVKTSVPGAMTCPQ